MDRNEIIRIAREAGWGGDAAEAWADGYEAGAAAERDACLSNKVINAANILGSDTPAVAVGKLQAAIRARG